MRHGLTAIHNSPTPSVLAKRRVRVNPPRLPGTEGMLGDEEGELSSLRKYAMAKHIMRPRRMGTA